MVKNLNVAFWVTVFCFILAYPISHLLATLPMKYSNLLMICVLLPFWTHYWLELQVGWYYFNNKDPLMI